MDGLKKLVELWTRGRTVGFGLGHPSSLDFGLVVSAS